MDNDSIKAFGEALVTTLEPGDVDINGNRYADENAYNVELDRQADKALLKRINQDKPF
jgi:hypothetical protein